MLINAIATHQFFLTAFDFLSNVFDLNSDMCFGSYVTGLLLN